MKQTIIIFFAFFLLCLCGCRSEFDIDVQVTGELCLVCYPGPRDTTIIQLYQTVPVGGRYDGLPYLLSADIAFSVDGVAQNVEQAVGPVGSVPEGCWFVPGRLDSGSTVEISAAAEPASPVAASTTIPSLPPEFDYYIESGEWTDLYIAFEDDPFASDYYGVAVICERTNANYSGQTVTIRYLSPVAEGTGTHEIAVIKDYYDVGFSGWSLWPKWTSLYGVRVWPDTGIKGKRVNLAARFDSPVTRNGSVAIFKIRYKVRLYRFTEDFYRYLAALDYQEQNEYATYGIIPMKTSFTNVTGGCGILAGWSMRESEWIEVPTQNYLMQKAGTSHIEGKHIKQ